MKKKEFTIKEIISDEEVRLVPNASNPTDIEKIESPFKNIPRIDQAVLFESVFKHLNNGNCIGIFPEVKKKNRNS